MESWGGVGSPTAEAASAPTHAAAACEASSACVRSLILYTCFPLGSEEASLLLSTSRAAIAARLTTLLTRLPLVLQPCRSSEAARPLRLLCLGVGTGGAHAAAL